MINALTIDIEDYFQVHAFSNLIRFEDWENYESRVENNTHRILDLLSGPSCNPQSRIGNPIRATFFCLGWIAKRFPLLIKEIYVQGHEVACHGYSHQLVYHQSPEEFREDIRKAKAVLEDITGNEVMGYRAPSYSITEKSLWAFSILVEEGFKYDSSIFPIRHDFYGIPNAPRFPSLVSISENGGPKFEPLWSTPEPEPRTPSPELGIDNSSTPNPQSEYPQSAKTNQPWIMEFPLSTIRLANLNWPVSGGGYFRILPYSIFRKGLKRINEREGRPFIFYLHPWELDFDQPRIQGAGLRSRFRHYLNLDKTENRFVNLLKEFKFNSIKSLLNTNLPNMNYLIPTGTTVND